MFKKKINNVTSAIKLTTIVEPTSVITEQIKTIRTNINFSATEQNLRTLMITSAMLGEGKSTVSSNLAVEYANEGMKVLLVDADLRRPTVHKTFGLSNRQGLSSWLAHQTSDINDAIHQTVDNLFVMTSGPKPPNPAELLGSKMMDEFLNSATRKLDLVIVDAPPILPVTDSQLLANKVDGTVLVVRQNVAQKAAVRDAVSALKRSHAHILGAVLNDVSDGKHSGYYGYNNGYYSEQDDQ
ncbi:exopolysaccharide biosynthesis protein [Lactiplantibacillus fabifermentans T30PCM01]|uniref:non-specific protein-tyrosine kinase n=2 Tax=Lactiplantibacillus fabifermentans TaxID=483011 RepID=W6T4D6_9LACO|nr:CpsD/CapB family tyrosine-protein kinase [Lactiplantibacillus fabifermentans]ETY72714.1 exopolysaccharide biosynthesis protein [Lactiplantibacillus fabifermentans T30PCM01]